MVKSHGKKLSKLFFYDNLVKCRRNLNFEKMDTASYIGKNDGICGVPQTKYDYGSVKKSKCLFSCHFQIDKKM